MTKECLKGPLSALAAGLCLVLVTFGTVQAQPAYSRSDLRPLSEVRPPSESPLHRLVTLHATAVSLASALHEVGRQAGINVVFSTERVTAEGEIDVDIAGVSAVDALKSILETTALEAFATPGETVVILPSETALTSDERRRTALPQGQSVRGTVVDAATKVPLVGANVIVVGSDPLIGTSTDPEGRFVLRDVPLGRQSFQVSYIGYTPVVLPEVMVTAAKEAVINVELREQVHEGREVVVRPEVQKDQPVNDMTLVSARSFSVEETRRFAGGLDDPARMASSFAGVATGAGIQENAVVVRGNAPKGVLWRLEGVEIPNPNHFAGLAVMGAGGLTLFSSQVLADSDFLTSAFPAEYGNALAGIFDIRFRSGNASTREHALQVGLIGLDVASEGPFVVGKPSTYLFNYRYSTIGLLMPLLPTEDVARFQDLSFKLHFPTQKMGVFDVWGIGGLDGQAGKATVDSTDWQYEEWDRLESDLSLGVGAAGVGHTLLLTPRTYLRSSLAATINRTVIDQKRISDDLVLLDDLAARSTSSHLILSSNLNHKFNAHWVQRTGVSVDRILYDVALQSVIDQPGLLQPVAVEQGASTLVQAYTQAQIEPRHSLAIQAGVHVQHFALTGHTALEPRIGVRLSIGDGRTLSAGYGLHSQMEDLRIYFVQVGADRPNLDLGFARAHHGVVGYEHSLSDYARFKVEGYLQRLFDVPVIPDSSFSLVNFTQDWSFAHALSNSGAGRNYGVEATYERFLHRGYYLLFTGSVFRSVYRGGDGVWRPTRWSRGVSINALGGREYVVGRSVYGVNARLSAMGGLRRSPIDRAESRQAGDVIFDESHAFSTRESPLILLDVTLTYRRNHRRVSQVWALQVKNALAAKETVLRYNERTDHVDEVREGFPLPVLSYKLEF